MLGVRRRAGDSRHRSCSSKNVLAILFDVIWSSFHLLSVLSVKSSIFGSMTVLSSLPDLILTSHKTRNWSIEEGQNLIKIVCYKIFLLFYINSDKIICKCVEKHLSYNSRRFVHHLSYIFRVEMDISKLGALFPNPVKAQAASSSHAQETMAQVMIKKFLLPWRSSLKSLWK